MRAPNLRGFSNFSKKETKEFKINVDPTCRGRKEEKGLGDFKRGQKLPRNQGQRIKFPCTQYELEDKVNGDKKGPKRTNKEGPEALKKKVRANRVDTT